LILVVVSDQMDIVVADQDRLHGLQQVQPVLRLQPGLGLLARGELLDDDPVDL
jgi:hypothetical protein